MKKRKRAAPSKRLRPSTAPKPSETAVQPPTTVSKAPVNIKPQTDASENRPGAGRMSGNLFEDRNWLLHPNYLNNDCKNAPSPKSPIRKKLRQMNS